MADLIIQAEAVLAIIVVVIVLIFVLARSLRIIRPYEKGVVERFGRYNRTASQGLAFLLPFAEILRKVDMRETVIDVPPQVVITKDNVSLEVDAVIYFEVTDPFRVIYNVSYFEDAALKLAQTNLRNVIGTMSLDESLVSRDQINTALRSILDDATDKWGVRITRVEIKRIDPPKDITEAMGRQMKAERTKRAAILEAEGLKQSEILKAEGHKRSKILEAEGQAEAIEKVAEAERTRKIKIAEGEAQSILNTFRAVHEGKASQDVLALKYMEALEKISEGNATKIFLPLETSGVLGAVASIGEAFKDAKMKVKKIKKGKEEDESEE
ncbi:MAG: SPFH domain-containing protein [Candidatus Altiarchaeota archaeon]